ncbi:hypothetical protein K7432_008663 [Basidiobolus ranarum]|uniref:Uncharacterized protein n=1 Tax=Basidiobolus ranarum TaxID=34480 RepID=A0ABR2VZ38_9FUNG
MKSALLILIPLSFIYLASYFIVSYLYADVSFSSFASKELSWSRGPQRIQEAEKFIQNLPSRNTPPVFAINPHGLDVCIGILPSNHPENFLQVAEVTIGSLFDTFTAEDRSRIHVTLFLPETGSKAHLEATKGYSHLLNSVLLYPEQGYQKIVSLDNPVASSGGQEYNRNTKEIFEYAHILQHCDAKRPMYTLILRDVVATRDWFRQLELALASVNYRDDWLYMRMFYSEELLGFHLRDSLWIFLYISASIVLFKWMLHRFLPGHPNYHTFLTISLVLLICLIPWSIGRQNLFPISSGASELPNGCCTEAVVYNQNHIPALLSSLLDHESSHIRPLTSRLSQFATAQQLRQLAWTPSAFQAVGVTLTNQTRPRSHGSISFERGYRR